MVVTRREIFRFSSTLDAAIASGGEMMPPSKKPSSSGKSGISQCEIYATAAAVSSTSPNASSVIGLRMPQNSCHDVFHADEYNNGGRKTTKTILGSSRICGTPGI